MPAAPICTAPPCHATALDRNTTCVWVMIIAHRGWKIEVNGVKSPPQKYKLRSWNRQNATSTAATELGQACGATRHPGMSGSRRGQWRLTRSVRRWSRIDGRLLLVVWCMRLAWRATTGRGRRACCVCVVVTLQLPVSVCMATTLQHCCYLHDRPSGRPTRLARQCLNCRRFFFLNRRATPPSLLLLHD